MRTIKLVLICLLLSSNFALAQKIFIIEGDTLSLHKEVEGTLSLYWNEERTKYRYFVQKGNRMVELRDRELDGETRKEYKLQLERFTRDANIRVNEVKFVLYSIKHFINRYNAMVEGDYVYNASGSNTKQRVGLFVGLSNNRYTRNPKNVMAPVLGLEYEIYDPGFASRHSAFLHLRQSFPQDEFRYTSTQLSVNYRFKVLYFSGFDVHIDTEITTFYYSEESIYLTNEQGEVTGLEEERGFSFTAPLSFGVGTDIKVTSQSFMTFSYNDVFSLLLKGNRFFPMDFSIGYKYNL